MKNLKDLAKSFLPPSEPKIVEFIAVLGGWRKLDTPVLSNLLSCLICGGKEHYAVFCDPAKGSQRVWICANGVCESNTSVKGLQATNIPTMPKRSILWPKFCEISGIGDIHHDVKFDNIQQSHGKIEFMVKFCQKPQGIIFMQGETGTGKTYSAMGMCELFTRDNPSCIFITQVSLRDEWLKMQRGEDRHFIDKVNKVNLLVVDDFGTGEVTNSFLSYFMELINSRMQWTDRGTVITTNLNDEAMSRFCGEALSDRIKTGQLFMFNEKSRRKKAIL